MKFYRMTIYRARDGYRWRMQAPNGRIVADSSEAYVDRRGADRAAPTLIDAAHADVSPSGVKRWGKGHRPITEPAQTITGSGGNAALVAAFLAKHYGGHEGPGVPVDAPISTITTQDHHHLVTAHVTKFRQGSVGSDLADPLRTVTAGGQQARPGTGNAMGLVTAQLAKLRGTSNSAGMAEPLGTISAGGMHHAEVRALLLAYYGTDQAAQLGNPLPTATTHDRFGIVTVHGQDYVIADIGMRMLQPRELYRAQGFPDSYQIDRGADGRALSKAAQVRMCGNSVCPPLARAIVAANYVEAGSVRRAA